MYEYKVIRAPEEQGKSILGRAKATYCEALEVILNEQGLDDWEFQRSEPGPDKHPLLIFRRGVKKLEDELPGITMAHKPPQPERLSIQPRPARELVGDDHEALERLKERRRKLVVKKPEPAAETLPTEAKTNVSDILAAQIARAKEQGGTKH